MGFFGKKKKRRAVKHGFEAPFRYREPVITSREYRLYKDVSKKKLNWYERLTRLSVQFIKIGPDKKTREDIEKSIAFTGLRVTPDSVMSLMIMSIIFFVILAAVFALTGIVSGIISLVIGAFGFLVAYYFLKYPANLVKSMRIQASSQVVLAILYMVVSMRLSPNLERALRFAAANITGALAWDLRKLLWDIEMRTYYSADDALEDYIARWKPENEEFAESLRLIRDSQEQSPERATKELDESLDVILNGTKTRMKHYTQDLMMPVMVIHMMGIILPILGTIMAPLAAVFMSELVQPIHFVLGYNIVLPVVIVWFIRNTLSKRPITLSQVDISNHPDLPPKNTFFVKGKAIPVFPVALMVLLVFIVPPVLFFAQTPELLSSGIESDVEHTLFSLSMSILIILGIGFSLATYFILSNYQRLGLQSDIQTIESEFELALFQLGNRIAGGTPTEVAIEKSIEDVKDMKISGLFQKILNNIRSLGMTFSDALFHPEWGALRYYPSEMIRNIMTAVVDTAKRGITYASESMLRIAKYLRNIKETQEYIRDLLAETVSSMRFQAYFLTPLITGLIVSMASIIIKVLTTLGKYLDGVGVSQQMGFDVSNAFGNMKASVSPELFQIIIGIYLIEVIIILGMFLTKITQGENSIIQWYTTGKMLIVGIVIYFLVAMTANSMFGGLIDSALSGLGVV